jgi:hypothetical protein
MIDFSDLIRREEIALTSNSRLIAILEKRRARALARLERRYQDSRRRIAEKFGYEAVQVETSGEEEIQEEKRIRWIESDL